MVTVNVVIIPVHGTSVDGAGTSERHLTVATTSDKAEAQKHLRTMQESNQTYYLRAGRRLQTCCVVADVPQELWGPMDASRAKWEHIEESRRGLDHVMHIAGASPDQDFRLQSREAQIREIG